MAAASAMVAASRAKVVDFQEYRRRREADRREEPVSEATASVVWGYAWVPMVMVYPLWPIT